MAPQFGTDGVRGVANEELTPEVAVALVRAAVEVLGGERLVVGRDTRRSGEMLEAAVVAGATAAGVNVELLGVVPSPAVAWAAADRQAPGLMISASHNPFADNGIKLFAADGNKLSDVSEARIQSRYLELLRQSEVPGPVGAKVGVREENLGVGGWVDKIASSVSSNALAGLSLVVDGANGAASEFGPATLRKLGAKVIAIGDAPDGININEGYGSTSPQKLAAAVVESKADAGVAFDGDADRLVAVDSHGEIVDGDRVLAILAADWKSRGQLQKNTVVVTVMTNLGFHVAMEAAGVEVLTTGVGDRYVLEALNENGLSLGGEQSGHIICRDINTTGDGILSAVQLFDVVVRSGRPLSELAGKAMVTVPQVLKNVRLSNRSTEIVPLLSEAIAEIERRFGKQGRVLVRSSGTEPLLRIMVEHFDANEANIACDSLVEKAKQLVG